MATQLMNEQCEAKSNAWMPSGLQTRLFQSWEVWKQQGLGGKASCNLSTCCSRCPLLYMQSYWWWTCRFFGIPISGRHTHTHLHSHLQIFYTFISN
jgi:hypothetical protein